MKRRVRDLLPMGSGRRVLRFSGTGRRPSPSERDDEDGLYLALGRIVANWSLIESASGHVLMGLIGSRDETLARAIVAGHSAWSLTGGGGGPAAWDVMSQRAKRGAREDLFPAGVPELEELARDIADCEERLAKLHARVLEDMNIADDQPE
jgi:hypothetical protein